MYKFDDAVRQYGKQPTKECLAEQVAKLLAEMTQKEKFKTLYGRALGITIRDTVSKGRYYNCSPYPAGGVKRLNIPPVLFADGPRGCVLGKSTCFPVSMLRGATFDDELEYRVGAAIAKECIAGGANYFAGICINLLRNPKWGRAQETYGEDQFLLGKMGAALTKAVQDKGMIACPKHFALNSIEDLRFSVDAKIDDRTLREVYLPHFKKCIDVGALSIMGAYNRVNGVYACENKQLLTDILRDEWGFDGFSISDFMFGIYDCANSINAGLDIEMPYPFRYLKLGTCLKKHQITQDVIDTSVKRVLGALIRSYTKKQSPDVKNILCKEHIELAREVASKGIVLLKNKNDVLPIPQGSKLAVVGRYADKKNVGDHGSSQVHSPYAITPYKGIARVYKPTNVTIYSGAEIDPALLAARDAEYIIVCVGSDYKQEGEFLINLGKLKKKPQGRGGDRESLHLPKEDVELIRAMAETGKKVIVNIMGGSAYVINEWSELVDGILMTFYSGLEGGNALADILCGNVNPSGRLPFTIAKDEKDYPDFLRIEDQKYSIEYGYYHGYALLDKMEIQPQFPFGFGLSYTSFNYNNISVFDKGDDIIVSMQIENTGNRFGATVPQVYVGSKNEEVGRPIKQLKGFMRVELEAGQSKDIEILVSKQDLQFYDSQQRSWSLDKEYVVFVGKDCKDAENTTIDLNF